MITTNIVHFVSKMLHERFFYSFVTFLKPTRDNIHYICDRKIYITKLSNKKL